MDGIEIHEYGPDDVAVVEEAVAVINAVGAADSPWEPPLVPANRIGYLRHGWDGETPRAFAGRVGGRIVALGEISVSEWDNTHLAWLGLRVHPDVRRQGHGSAMLRHLEDLAKELGRTSIGTDSWDAPAPAAFAARHRLEPRAVDICRAQLLAEVDPGLVEKLYAEAEDRAADYELIRIVGRTPEELMPAVSEMTAAINDAPTDDLDIEDEVFPPERIRAYEDAQAARGHTLYRLIARHRGTGELAGHTVVAVEAARPGQAEQHDTSVVRAHRGHRLGLLLKAGMLRWLAEAEPGLVRIETWNAESNDHMIAVNEQLGFRVMDRAICYQRDV